MSGAERIASERERQIGKKGWTAEHDTQHESGELALAGACYAAAAAGAVPLVHDSVASGETFTDMWPWFDEDDRRKDGANFVNHLPKTKAERIRFLEKAGALIAAEIDRLIAEQKSEHD